MRHVVSVYHSFTMRCDASIGDGATVCKNTGTKFGTNRVALKTASN
jgi:hypothetical protein